MAARRPSTIGTSPFDAVIPPRPQAPNEEPAPAATPSAPARPRTTKPAGPARRTNTPSEVSVEKMTVYLPADLVDRAKNAVYWTPGLTLTRLATTAVERAVVELERSHGQRFPPREHRLTGGRPLG